MGTVARVQPSASAVPVSVLEGGGRLERLVEGVEFEDLVDPVRTRGAAVRSRDQVPASGLEDQPVRFQAAFDVRGGLPTAVADAYRVPVPDGGCDGGQVGRLVRVPVPARCVEVEPLLDAYRLLPQLAGEGGPQLELGPGQHLAETEFGGGAGESGEEDGPGLVGGEPGQPGAVAVEEAVAATVPGVPVQRDVGRAEGFDIAVDGPDRHLQCGGQFVGRHAAPVLEEQEEGNEPSGAHGGDCAPPRGDR